MAYKPTVSDDPMYLLLRDKEVQEFNRQRAAGATARLAGCDFSGMDLRGLIADGLDLQDGCFDDADLRGVDLRGANLEGATIHGARIGGAFFPSALGAQEIALALEHGTRLRYSR